MACGQKIGSNLVNNQAFKEAASSTEMSQAITPTKTSAKMKFSLKVGIISIVALLAIASSTLAYVVIVKKTPKELFILSELNSYNQTINGIKERYVDDLEFQKKAINSPTKTNIELSGDLSVNGRMTPSNTDEVDVIKNIVKNSKITISSSSNPLQQINQNLVSLVFKGSTMVDAELFQSKDRVGLKVPVLYDKYLYLQPSQFGNMARKLDPYYEGPEQIDLNQFSGKNLSNKQKEWKKIGLKYGKFIISNLSEEYFKIEKGISYSSPDGETKLRKLSLRMSNDQVKNLLSKLIDELIRDSEFQNILSTDIVEIAKLSTNYVDEQYSDPLQIIEEIKDSLTEMKVNINDLKFINGLDIVLYINNKNIIVDRQINFTVDNYDSVNFNINTKNWDGKNNTKTASLDLIIKLIDEKDTKLTVNTKTITTKEKEGIHDQFTGSFILLNRGNKEEDVTLKVNTLFNTQKNNKKKSDTEFELLMKDQDFGYLQSPNLKGKITRIVNQNLAKNYSNQEFGVELTIKGKDYFDYNQEFGISVNVKKETELEANVQLPALKAENSIDLTTKSKNELNNLSNDIQYSINRFMQRNQSLFVSN